MALAFIAGKTKNSDSHYSEIPMTISKNVHNVYYRTSKFENSRSPKFKKLGLHKLSKERSAHQHQVFNSTSHHFFMMIHNHTFLLCYRMF